MDKAIITDYENLYRSYLKAKRGKGFNGSTARFREMALDGLHLLKKQLEDQTYAMGRYNEFKIHEPKERVIKSCSFKDKLVQHCLCDYILLPRLKNQFIECNYAGQIGKGTMFGLDHLKGHMLKHYSEHGNDGWILKCDITKFFYQIDHEILRDIVDYYFPSQYVRWLNHIFIDSTDGPGLALGNQAAQVYALLMLDGIDHAVSGELGIRKYGRYMDDFYLIHQSRTYLRHCLEYIHEAVESLGLSLNGKTQIVPFRNGIPFLGFHHYVTAEGKYIRRLKSENKRRNRKKIRKMITQVKSGQMSEKKLYERYNAWKNHASHGDCIKLCHTMDLYVEKLMNGT